MEDRSSKASRLIKVPSSGPVATTSYQNSRTIGLNSDWPPERVDGLKILGYEVQMFLGLVPIALDPDRFRQAGERRLKHAVVESACLHGRNVCWILLDDRGKREWKLKELLKPSTEQQRKIDDARAELREAWTPGRRKDDPKSACVAFNAMVM